MLVAFSGKYWLYWQMLANIEDILRYANDTALSVIYKKLILKIYVIVQ